MEKKIWDQLTVRDLIWESFDRFTTQPACGFVNNRVYTYGDVRSHVEQVAFAFRKLGLGRGDRVAILGNNSPHWVISYFAILSLGIIAVPVLPDFHTDEIRHIMEHAGVNLLLISQRQLSRFTDEERRSLPRMMQLDDFSMVASGTSSTEETNVLYGSFDPMGIAVQPDDLASIIYTSGTTGFSKGVMLTHRSLVENVRQCALIEPLEKGEVFISILPLSHSFENTVGCLLPFSFGAMTHYLEKPPTASVLVPALQKVRPTYMLSVPLVIEKIFKSQVKGKFESKRILRFLYGLTPVRKILHRIAGKKLIATFGGRLKFFGIGGAKLDYMTERFLKEARFPYAIGYGLTETAPLLSGVGVAETRFQSAGRPVDGVEMRINEPDPETGIGEIWARGVNIMKGYYREPDITGQVLTPDGWFRTGDLGLIDRDGFLYIKGRLKNVIVGASGENIYPEEIESVINRFQYVMESLVINRGGKLVALVRLNYEELERQFKQMKADAHRLIDEKAEQLKNELHQFVNERVNRYSRIQMIYIQEDPFEKTATKKIKRFLYK